MYINNGGVIMLEKYNKYILVLIGAVVIFMSIGYSVLESNLRISGEVNYRADA